MEVGGALAAGSFQQHLHQAGGGIERVARLSAAHGLGDAAPIAVICELDCQHDSYCTLCDTLGSARWWVTLEGKAVICCQKSRFWYPIPLCIAMLAHMLGPMEFPHYLLNR